MAEIATTERLPFPLAKPNPDTFVTQASEIGYGGAPIACGLIYDISVAHAVNEVPAQYESLSAALGTSGANIPQDVRRGGMAVKFIQSPGNKYVQYRLMADSWSSNVADWQSMNIDDVFNDLDVLNLDVLGFNSLRDYSGNIENTNISAFGSAAYKILRVSGGEHLIISSSPYCRIVILSDFAVNPVLPYDFVFATGETGRRQTAGEMDVVLPNDARFVLIQSIYGGSTGRAIFNKLSINGIDYLESIKYNHKEDIDNIQGDIDNIQGDIDSINEEIYGIQDVTPVTIKEGNMNFDGKWNNVSSGYETKFIAVNAGDEIYITSGRNIKTYFGFLTNNDSPVDGDSIPYVSGYSRIEVLPTDAPYTGVIPQGCNYLAVVNKYNNFDQYAPLTLLVNGVSPDDLTIEPQKSLIKTCYPKCIVIYSLNNFSIYQQDRNVKDLYYLLELNHVVNNSEIVYLDCWRIASVGGIYIYTGSEFIKMNKVRLLATPENEFAFKMVGKADFTGGFHGDERIDTDNSFAKFFIDGVELTSDELSVKFTRSCNSFYMLQKSTLHDTTIDGTTPIEGHPIIGIHFKKTEFVNQGYRVTNRVDFDFTEASYDSIGINTWFAGLCCISKDCAEKFYSEDYVIHTAQNDGSSVNMRNVLGSAVNFWSDTNNMSCEVKSNVITEDDAACNITIWDRALPGDSDEKYYRYAPTKVVTTGSVFKSKMEVSWQYRNDNNPVV